MDLLDLLKVFWISFAASAIVAWPIYRWLKSTVKQKIDPYAPETHQAKQGTPTMGGLIILVGALAGLVTAGWSILTLQQTQSVKGNPILAFLVLIIGFGAIGFVDDFVVPRMGGGKRGLGWKQKIVLEVLVAGLPACQLVYQGVSAWAVLIVGTVVILFFANAFNFVDGLDGLAGSVWLPISSGLAVLSWERFPVVATSLVALSAGVLVFLFLNAPPAKVFMGDVGSLPLGACLGYSAILVCSEQGYGGLSFNATFIPSLLILSLLMIAELVPVPLQVAYFKLTKGKRLFPATPIHHGFEKKGWPESRVMWTFALFQLLLSLAAVTVYQLQAGALR